MSVRHIDDHLSPADREAAALFRGAADDVVPGRGPDLDEVVALGRRRSLRRRGVEALAVAAGVGLLVAAGIAGRPASVPLLPASPQPERSVAPAQTLDELARGASGALTDAGVLTSEPLEWRSLQRSTGGSDLEGHTASAYVPVVGASLDVVSLRTVGGPAVQDEASCATMPAAIGATGHEATCTESVVSGGRLVKVTDGSRTSVTFALDGHLTQVDTDIATLGAGPQLANPRALPPEVLVQLATDSRLRW